MSRPAAVVSPDELYNVLVSAASQDPAAISTSAKRLKEMLELAGTFNGLSAIATRRDIPLPIRQQSIIQFKNAALSHWRAKRLLSDEQRTAIRARSLSLLDEEDDVISNYNKVIVGKIARMDFPSQWPNLISDLTSVINTNFQTFFSSGGNNPRAILLLRRSLNMLNTIIKELTAIKMPAGIKLTAQLVREVHTGLESHYTSLASHFPSPNDVSALANPATSDVIQFAHLTYKCLSKMEIWAWARTNLKNNLELEPWVRSFFSSSSVQVRVLMDLRISLCMAMNSKQPSDAIACRSLDYLTRHVRQFGKLFRRMQQLNASKFVDAEGCSDLVLFYWNKVAQATTTPSDYIADSQWAAFPVRLIVQAMAIFKESIGQWSPNKRGAGSETLPKEFVEEAVKLLVIRFIPLNPKDLDAWLADPEEWVNVEDKENEQWEYELRPCAERVLMTLASQYQSYVTPLLVSTFNQIVGVPTVDLESIVQKEALYCAIGRCAIRLRDAIPFQDWVSKRLAVEVKDQNPNFPIIKRRIAWVLGKWVADDCAPPTAEVWAILMHLLGDRGPGTDAVVRFTAAAAMRECVDSMRFNAEVFLPHLSIAISQLIQLSAEADTLETKRRVTQSLNVIIERMGAQIVPYMDMIATPIPQLWTVAGDDYLYKAALVETVTKLIESSGANSMSLNSLTVPLLRESFSDRARLHLDEDGLALWKAALQNAVSIDNPNGSPSLYDLFPIAITLLAENLDLLGSITSVIQSYFLLGAVKILQGYAVPLFNAFAQAMNQAVQTNQKDMIITLQLLVQLTPAQLWAEPMHLSGLFGLLIKTVMEDKAITLLLTEDVCLFARMAISDSAMLSQLIAATAASTNRPESELWNGVLDQWWRRFDNMSEPRYRKLAAMGISCLVAVGRPEVLERLNGEIFNLWLDVFGEMKEALAEISEVDQESTLSPLVTFWRDTGSELPSAVEEIQGTPEYTRWIEIYKTDPVEREKLTVFVAKRLQEASHVCGGDVLESKYLRDADPGVLKQLREELTS